MNTQRSELFPDASNEELAAVLKQMVETGDVSLDAVNNMRAQLGQDIKGISQIDTGKSEKQLSPEQTEQLFSTLKARFNANKKRHKVIEWSKVEARLNEASPEKLWSLNEMERTGGEPDVVSFVEETGEYEFWDFSKESPKGRREVCYDREGQEEAERQGKGNAVDMAEAMGLGGLLNEGKYRKMQEFGEFDENSSSWIDTPASKREAGVALFAGWHHGDVFVDEVNSQNHRNYGAFRGWLRV